MDINLDGNTLTQGYFSGILSNISADNGAISSDGSGDLTVTQLLIPVSSWFIRYTGAGGDCGFTANVDKDNGDAIDDPTLAAFKLTGGVQGSGPNMTLQVCPATGDWGDYQVSWISWFTTGHFGVGLGSDDGVNQLQVFGSTSLDFGAITTTGSGGASFGDYVNVANGIGNAQTSNTWQVGDDGSAAFSLMKPHTVSAPSSPSAGWMYFDGTNFKVYSGGAWKTVQLV